MCRFNSDGYILAVHHGYSAHCWKKVENVLLKVVDKELGFSEIRIHNPEATKVNDLVCVFKSEANVICLYHPAQFFPLLFFHLEYDINFAILSHFLGGLLYNSFSSILDFMTNTARPCPTALYPIDFSQPRVCSLSCWSVDGIAEGQPMHHTGIAWLDEIGRFASRLGVVFINYF